MITMTMTRQAAEMVKAAVSGLPVHTQANVEAYQAVSAALDRDAGREAAGGLGDSGPRDHARAVENMDEALSQRLWGPAGPRTFPVYLSAADIGELSRVVRGHQPWNETPAWAVRVLNALRGAR